MLKQQKNFKNDSVIQAAQKPREKSTMEFAKLSQNSVFNKELWNPCSLRSFIQGSIFTFAGWVLRTRDGLGLRLLCSRCSHFLKLALGASLLWVKDQIYLCAYLSVHFNIYVFNMFMLWGIPIYRHCRNLSKKRRWRRCSNGNKLKTLKNPVSWKPMEIIASGREWKGMLMD